MCWQHQCTPRVVCQNPCCCLTHPCNQINGGISRASPCLGRAGSCGNSRAAQRRGNRDPPLCSAGATALESQAFGFFQHEEPSLQKRREGNTVLPPQSWQERRDRLITSSLGPRNCAMPELLKALNQPHPPVRQPYHLLWYKHSPALIRNKSHFQGFCTVTSAPSLTGASKLLPAVLFLCKAQRNPCKMWGSSYFISSHSFNERGKFPDHLLHFEVHHFKLPRANLLLHLWNYVHFQLHSTSSQLGEEGCESQLLQQL